VQHRALQSLSKSERPLSLTPNSVPLLQAKTSPPFTRSSSRLPIGKVSFTFSVPSAGFLAPSNPSTPTNFPEAGISFSCSVLISSFVPFFSTEAQNVASYLGPYPAWPLGLSPPIRCCDLYPAGSRAFGLGSLESLFDSDTFIFPESQSEFFPLIYCLNFKGPPPGINPPRRIPSS